MSYLKTIAILDLPVKKIEKKKTQSMYTTTCWTTFTILKHALLCLFFFVVVKALSDFKTTTILVQLILNGKGSNWSTWVESCLHFFFIGSNQYSWLFLNKKNLAFFKYFVVNLYF